MSTSVADPCATSVWCDDQFLWVTLADGRKLATPFGFFPRLMHASADQRSQVEMRGGGRALHWPALDEDISVAGLIEGVRDGTRFAREHRATCAVCLPGAADGAAR